MIEDAPTRLPLAGVRIAITRPEHLAAELAELLEAQGATTLATPTIQILPPEDPRALDEAAASLAEYDWIVFSSANAVNALLDRRVDWRPIDGRPRLAAVGPATNRLLLNRLGESTSIFTGDSALARSLFETMRRAATLARARVLIPRADIAPGELARWLTDEGARVDAPIAYRTASDPAGARELARAIEKGRVDVVVFTSGSTVRGLLEALPEAGRRAFHCVSIGPRTTAALQAAGMDPDVEASEHHTAGLVEAVVSSLAR